MHGLKVAETIPVLRPTNLGHSDIETPISDIRPFLNLKESYKIGSNSSRSYSRSSFAPCPPCQGTLVGRREGRTPCAQVGPGPGPPFRRPRPGLAVQQASPELHPASPASWPRSPGARSRRGVGRKATRVAQGSALPRQMGTAPELSRSDAPDQRRLERRFADGCIGPNIAQIP